MQWCVSNFNPHTREGCDDAVLLQVELDRCISIHTPVKGVTRIDESLRESLEISIHTPVKGVTDYHEREDAEPPISIHTPVKGVTTLVVITCLPVKISIHTPVKGVTSWVTGKSSAMPFQSTHP